MSSGATSSSRWAAALSAISPGFVAATVLRGIGLVQVPTSLLAAVDSSVGGKTGINHAAGKNLIGAFFQPPLVLVDTALLRTMPARELRSGWAEIVKHAVIQRSTPGGERGDLPTVLERNAARLLALEEPALSYVVWRNIALKAAVVAADERETGIRAFLNFGHTLGHAIEAADYQLLHGEAVALGMRAAAELGVRCGTCEAADAERIGRLIDLFDLPSVGCARRDAGSGPARQRQEADRRPAAIRASVDRGRRHRARRRRRDRGAGGAALGQQRQARSSMRARSMRVLSSRGWAVADLGGRDTDATRWRVRARRRS